MKTELYINWSDGTFGFLRLRPGKLRRTTAMLAGAVAGILLAAQTAPVLADGDQKVAHVLLISVDGMHQSDLAWYVQTHPKSTLAALAAQGIDYSNASTPFPYGLVPWNDRSADRSQPVDHRRLL